MGNQNKGILIIGIIENLLTKVDNLILCGGMTYTFSKALGGKIGMSICEDDKVCLRSGWHDESPISRSP